MGPLLTAITAKSERGRTDPSKIFNDHKEGDELDENEVIYDANKILLIENAKALLLPHSD